MSNTTLLDLPYEILLEIFEEFDQRSLQPLTATCRALREVTQPLVVKKQMLHLQNLADRGSLSFGGHPTVKDLFRNGGKVPTLYLRLGGVRHGVQLSEDLQAFRTLLLHLNDIGSVDIFPSLSNNWDIPPAVTQLGWIYLFADILNIAVSKPQANVSVRRGTIWKTLGRPFEYEYAGLPLKPFPPIHRPTPPIASDISSAARRSLHVFQQLWKVIAKLGIRTKQNNRPRNSAPESAGTIAASSTVVRIPRHNSQFNIVLPYAPCSLLETFHINASFLLEVPFFDWTLHILHESPIKTLTFSNVELIHYDWEYILSSITIPTLLHISFGSSNIAFPDLQGFISRHPSLTTLNLSEGVAVGHLTPFSSKALLPNLTHLLGNPEYLAHFLEPPSALPSLQSVTMTSEYGLRVTAYDFRQFEPVLLLIAQRTDKISLKLSFRSQVGLYTWLPSLLTRLMAGELSEVPNVTTLELFINTPPPQTVADAFVNLIRLFPSLENLFLGGAFWADDLYLGQIKNGIWNGNPGLQMIDGERRL